MVSKKEVPWYYRVEEGHFFRFLGSIGVSRDEVTEDIIRRYLAENPVFKKGPKHAGARYAMMYLKHYYPEVMGRIDTSIKGMREITGVDIPTKWYGRK